VTIKDLDLGRALAAGVTDNRQWREDRPGQVTVPRASLVETIRRIVDAA
jgi:histidyl-tRNA synthetase